MARLGGHIQAAASTPSGPLAMATRGEAAHSRAGCQQAPSAAAVLAGVGVLVRGFLPARLSLPQLRHHQLFVTSGAVIPGETLVPSSSAKVPSWAPCAPAPANLRVSLELPSSAIPPLVSAPGRRWWAQGSLGLAEPSLSQMRGCWGLSTAAWESPRTGQALSVRIAGSKVWGGTLCIPVLAEMPGSCPRCLAG